MTCPLVRSHLVKPLFSHRLTVQNSWSTLFHCCSHWSIARVWSSGLWSRQAGLHGQYTAVTIKLSLPVTLNSFSGWKHPIVPLDLWFQARVLPIVPSVTPFPQISFACMHVYTHNLKYSIHRCEKRQLAFQNRSQKVRHIWKAGRAVLLLEYREFSEMDMI